MRAKTSVLGLVAVLLLGGCGDDDKESSAPATTVAPATTTTLSQAQLDKQKAQRIVLTAPDLPGYSQDPPDPSSVNSPEFEAAANACANNNPVIVPLQSEANDPRGAASPDFSKGETVTVSSSVTFAETEDQARTAMADVGAASFPACFSKAFTAELKKDPTYSNVSVTTTKLPAITAGDQSLGYRVVAKFRTEGTNVTANIDFTFVRVGRAVASLEDLSVPAAFPAAERLRLAQLLAGRMAAP